MSSSDDNISVSMTADASDLTQGFNEAAEIASDSMDKIEESAKAAGAALDSDVGEGADKAKEKLAEVEEEALHVGEAFEKLQGQIKMAMEASGIMLAYEAIEKVVEAAEHAAEAATNIVNMSEVLGVTTEQFQSLAEAAKESGVGQSMLSRTVIRLKTDLDQAREGSASAIDKLRELGIVTEQVNDPMFNVNAALVELSDRLRNAATATDTMSGVSHVFGARAAMVAQALKHYHGSAEDVAETMKILHGLNEETLGDLEAVHVELSRTGTAWDNLKSSMVAAFAVATGSGKQEAPSMTKAMQSIGDTGDSESAAAAAEAAEKRKALIHEVTKAEVDAQKAAVQLTKAGSAERVAAVQQEVLLITQLYGNAYVDKVQASIRELNKTKMEYAQKEEEDLKKRTEEALRNQEKYDRAIEASVKKSVLTYEKDWKEFFTTYDKLQSAQNKAAEDAVVLQANAAEKILNAQMAAKHIDPETYLTAERAIIQSRLDAEMDYFNKMKALYADDAAKQLTYEDQKTKAAAKASDQMYAAQVKVTKDIEKSWESAMKPIEASWSSAMQSMANGTMTLQHAVARMLSDMVTGLFKNAMDTMVHNWVTGEQTKTNFSLIMDRIRSSSAKAAMTETTAASGVSAKTEIQNSGLSAMAGAYKAMVGIPYIGPILAVAAMAAAEAAVLGLIGKIASAEGGMEVDRDQLAFVHKDEKILPAHISQGINERILGNDPMGGRQETTGKGGDHYHITAHDARSFEKYVTSQAGRNAIAKAGKMAGSRGNRDVRSAGR